MANATIGVTSVSTGSLLDTESLTVGSNTVHRQRVQITGTTSTDVAKVAAADLGATDNAMGVRLVGQVAHDAADIGSPIKVGGKAVTAAPTAVSANDRVDARFDLVGNQWTTHQPSISGTVWLIGDTQARTVNRSLCNAVASGSNIIPAGGASLYSYCIGFVASFGAAAGTCVIEETTSGTDLFYVHSVATHTGQPYQVWAPQGMYLFKSAVNDAIKQTLASCTVTGVFFYVTSTVSI